MLKSLSVRNVVLIDKLDLDLASGFSVLSGETGAGKSILLDSLGLLLGRRADVGMIRSGCDKLTVVGTFTVGDNSGELARLCAEYDLDATDEIILKRTLDTAGKSKIFFNDEPITLKLLKEIGSLLVEIHGQFDNQGLLNPATHRQVLDSYGSYGTALQEMQAAYAAYKQAKTAYETAAAEYTAAQRDEEDLRHWVDELDKVKPQENEATVLEEQRRQLMHAEKILDNLATAQAALNAQPQSVRSALRQAEAAVARLNALLNDKYAELYNVLDTALINVAEAEEEMTAAVNEVNLNQNDIDRIEERLFKLKSLARKHQTTVDELPRVWAEMAQKLAQISHGEDNLRHLEAQMRQLWQDYAQKAAAVHAAREKTAAELDGKIMAELPALKMEKARFVTQISRKPESQWNETGADEVCFMVATNAGTPLGALNKVASGGELARLMLAIKVNLAQSSQIETMIFDEVDSGIGGATAQAVGEKLARLGERVQVLVVTHSPQVAALSRHHFKVEKQTQNNVTTTSLQLLNASQKQEEIARMLSGEQISDEARAAAKVLIGA